MMEVSLTPEKWDKQPVFECPTNPGGMVLKKEYPDQIQRQEQTHRKMYNHFIEKIKIAATEIKQCTNNNNAMCEDGRLDSALKEGPFLNGLRAKLLEENPTWDIQISPPRASCDVMINGLQINLKMTDCKTADNSCNKRAIYYSITGQTDYPYSSTWNDFLAKLVEAKAMGKIKMRRDPMTEYHYLVKNKRTGEVLLKSIFDIHTYISNPSNDLQINWRNEFANAGYATNARPSEGSSLTDDTQYLRKVGELLGCIQKSVKDMISKNAEFAEADLDKFLSLI